MSGIVFATGGTTGNSKITQHNWENYNFAVNTAALSLKPLFESLGVKSVANCLTAGNLWGGFLFSHEICRLLEFQYYPFASSVDKDSLSESINEHGIDTILCIPSFAEALITTKNKDKLSSLKNILYLGEAFPDQAIMKMKSLIPELAIRPIAYTTQETGPIGFQCPHTKGSKYHVYNHVRLKQHPREKELISTLYFPGGEMITEHALGDIGDILINQTCICGHNGTDLVLKGRISTSNNIMGISISIYEFIHTLNSIQDTNLSPSDIQLIVVTEGELGTGAHLLINEEHYMDENDILSALLSSSLIKKIISDANYFNVSLTNKDNFIKSTVSGKVKPFNKLNQRIDIPNSYSFNIKL